MQSKSREIALVGGRPSKWRAYAVGAALGLLLDDLAGDDWRDAVGAGTALDAYLRETLRRMGIVDGGGGARELRGVAPPLTTIVVTVRHPTPSQPSTSSPISRKYRLRE